jgi:hypothetical protein
MSRSFAAAAIESKPQSTGVAIKRLRIERGIEGVREALITRCA